MESQNKGIEQEFTYSNRVKAKYCRTSMKKKQKLIDYVMNQNYTIYRASRKLKISNSTSFFIIQNYRKYGHILERNSKRQIEKHLKNFIEPNQTQQLQIRIKQQPVSQQMLPQDAQLERINQKTTGCQKLYYPFRNFNFSYYDSLQGL